MCELFAMSSRYPADITFSLERFAQHGGLTAPHKDGWGIAFHDGYDTRIFREAAPASNSPTIRFIKDNAFSSRIVISHIRLATLGEVTLRNTQPFQRPLCGRMHVFAHNGDLPGIEEKYPLGDCDFEPIGNTDSEHAFCLLLQQMKSLWRKHPHPSLQQRHKLVASFARSIRPMGTANFIYSDGEYLFLHGHKRSNPGEKTPPRPPGLYWLCRTCEAKSPHLPIDGLVLTSTTAGQKAIMTASVPLTAEKWISLKEGEILVCKDGQVIQDVE
ncbi:MAG TPA: class II glutamine amidotransferase [Gammaproteobacteria bacterium]|nr:class II glutamine amidotransferase [Gammaproteobacteria bacterium]